jgi:hypothetical protein
MRRPDTKKFSIMQCCIQPLHCYISWCLPFTKNGTTVGELLAEMSRAGPSALSMHTQGRFDTLTENIRIKCQPDSNSAFHETSILFFMHCHHATSKIERSLCNNKKCIYSRSLICSLHIWCH